MELIFLAIASVLSGGSSLNRCHVCVIFHRFDAVLMVHRVFMCACQLEWVGQQHYEALIHAALLTRRPISPADSVDIYI